MSLYLTMFSGHFVQWPSLPVVEEMKVSKSEFVGGGQPTTQALLSLGFSHCFTSDNQYLYHFCQNIRRDLYILVKVGAEVKARYK